MDSVEWENRQWDPSFRLLHISGELSPAFFHFIRVPCGQSPMSCSIHHVLDRSGLSGVKSGGAEQAGIWIDLIIAMVSAGHEEEWVSTYVWYDLDGLGN